jgi:hypothetical protein
MSKRFWFSVFLLAGILAGSAPAQSLVPIDPATVTDGHVYLMENVGADVPDDSANNNNGTFVGSPQVVPGLNGNALKFNGTSDAVVLPNAATINTSTHQNKTIIAVFQCADVSKSEKQVVFEEGGSTRGANIYVHQGLVYAGGWNAADYTPQWAGTFFSAPIGSNEWHVVAAVLRNGTAAQEDDKFEVWLDGELIGKGPGGEFRSRTNANGIGYTTQTKYHDGNVTGASGGYFDGIVDEIWILNQALSEDDLSALTMGPRPFASGPSPRKGSMVDDTMSTLSWKPGDFAVSHNLYVGTSAAEIEAATPESAPFKGNMTAAEFLLLDLVPGQTYYWRVDGINPAEPNSPWKGEVWSFRVRPSTAWEPTPAGGLQYVGLDQDLSWNAGLGAVFHTVFVGTSFDEVNDAVAGMMTADPTYDPGPLQPGTTYYWRVDEFAFPANVTHKGPVWNFTTVPEIAVTDPNLVGWWTFEEGTGLTVVDWSGHGNHGTIIGHPPRVLGYHGEALEFDGRTDYVETNNTEDLAKWTICCWVTSPAAPAATSPTGPVHREKNYQLDWNHTNATFRSAAALSIGGTWYAASLGTLSGNTWYHLAASFDGTALKSYVNGVLITSTAATGVPDAEVGTLKFGRHSTAAQFFAGTVDGVRIYNRVLPEKELEAVMRGDPLLAGDPEPGRSAMVNATEVDSLRWSAGDTAASHNVYFGQDRAAVANADANAPEFKGNQKGVSFSLAGLVAFGGGDYFWRIDEVESNGTVHHGYVWKFTIPNFLIVEDFESYTDLEGERIYETWEDGWTNQTGSQVGNLQAPFAEQTIVNSGGQSMPVTYDNTAAPGVAEADRTFAPAQDWTAEGVTTLVIHFRGASGNTGQLYAKINGTKVPYNGAAGDLASTRWTAWKIDLAATGVNLASVKTLSIGVEGGSGVLYVDDIRLTKP